MIKPLSRENIKPIVAVIFLVSGAAGLIYQIVWFKYLALFLGNSTYAQMTVLATFLGGLALGNHIFGKKADLLTNPLRVYGILEIIIGLYCLAYPLLNSFIGNLFLEFSSSNSIDPQTILFNSLRLFVSASLLLIPTIAMGGTLPVLSKFFVDNLEFARRDTAILYFLNSFGAVIGIFFGGFILIKEFGLELTIYISTIINLLAGFFSVLLSIGAGANTPSPTIENLDYSQVEIPISKRTASIVVLVAGASGAAALLYELVWTRLLINFFGSSTYAFSIMLMSIISGITLGGWVVSLKFISRFDKIRALVFYQTAIAISTMIVLLFYERLPYYLWKLSSLFQRSGSTFPIFIAIEFIIIFLIIFIPSLFMGMTLPAAVEIISSVNKKIGFTVGKVFSVNTLGTVIGVLLTGLVLIPSFGIKNTFEIGIAANIIAALLLLGVHKKTSRFYKITSGAGVVIIFLIYTIAFPDWNQQTLSSGVFRKFKTEAPVNYEEFLKRISSEKVIFYKEGSAANVAVTQSVSNPDHKSLIINGKPDASSYFDMPTQVLLAQIPMLLHDNPKNVFVVGFGSGTTIGSVLTHDVDNVICAEISKEVIEAAPFFEKENGNCLSDKRLQVYNEDASTLLKIWKTKFDVIISEPSNPWIAGIGNLFSKEYFSKCYDQLNDNGIMVQWFHLYEADDDVVKLVLNTFSSVFENAELWTAAPNDVILVGYKNKSSLNYNALIEKFNYARVKNDLQRINILNPFTFLNCQLASNRKFYTMADEKPTNSEIHPKLEFAAPKAFYIAEQSNYIYTFDEKFDTLSNSLKIKEYAKLFPPGEKELINAIDFAVNVGKNYRFGYGLSKYFLELYPKNYDVSLLSSTAFEKLNLSTSRKPFLEELINLYPDSSRLIKDYNNILLLEKGNATNYLRVFSIDEQAKKFLSTTQHDSTSLAKIYTQLATAYLNNSEFPQAEYFASKAESIVKSSPRIGYSVQLDDLFYVLAITAAYKNEIERVLNSYLTLLNINSNYKDLFRLRRLVTWQTNELKKQYNADIKK